MGSDKTNLTIEPKEIDWRTATSISDEQVEAYGKDLLDNPMCESTYTREQMIEMFRLGASTITDMEAWKTLVSVQEFREKNTYSVMRKMNTGDIVKFPYDRWSAARCAASKLKTMFGCEFRVNKRALSGEQGDIQVERLK